MRNIITLAALALGLSAGVANADHFRGGSRQGGVVVRDHRGGGWDRGYHGGNWGGNRVVVREHDNWRGHEWRERDNWRWRGGGGYVVRQPIYVERPIIRERYCNYYRRPAILVENYAAMDGYYWVPGQWTWDGYQWQWYPGHYEPDPNYYTDGY